MFSKQTKNLGLPQWVGTDHPDFLTDINGAFNKIDENAGETGAEINGLPDRVTQISDTLTNQQASIATLQSDVASQKIEVANLKVAVEPVEGQGQQIEALETRADTVEQKVSALEQASGNTDDAVSAIQDKIADLEAADTAQQTKNGQLDTDIANLQTSVGNNQSAIEDLETFQTQAESDISGLRTSVNSLSNFKVSQEVANKSFISKYNWKAVEFQFANDNDPTDVLTVQIGRVNSVLRFTIHNTIRNQVNTAKRYSYNDKEDVFNLHGSISVLEGPQAFSIGDDFTIAFMFFGSVTNSNEGVTYSIVVRTMSSGVPSFAARYEMYIGN